MNGWALIALGLLLAVLDFGDFRFDWLWVAALVLIIIGAWERGAFRASTWIASDADAAVYSRIDQEIDDAEASR